MNRRGRGRSKGTIAVIAGLGGALGGALAGVSLLLDERQPPPASDPPADPPPDHASEAEPAPMPAPGFAAEAEPEVVAPAPPQRDPEPLERPDAVTVAAAFIQAVPTVAPGNSEPPINTLSQVPEPVSVVAAEAPPPFAPAAAAAIQPPIAEPRDPALAEPADAAAGVVDAPAEPLPDPLPEPLSEPPELHRSAMAADLPVAALPHVSDAAVPTAVPEPIATPSVTSIPAPVPEAVALAANLPQDAESPPKRARRTIERKPALQAQSTPAPAGAALAPAKTPLPEPAFGSVTANPTSAVRADPAALAPRVLPKPAFGTSRAAQAPGGQAEAAPAAAFAGPGIGMAASPGYGTTPPFTIDDELILQIQTRQGELSDTITAYGTRAGVYLPLGEIARLLDLAVVVSDEGQYAAGWVIDEKDTVAVNLRAGTLRHGEREIRLDPRDAAAMDGELYLRAERFADLMPVALKVDLRAQAVTMTTLQALPFEQRAARDAARARLDARGGASGAPRYPREDTPWQALGFPLADVELRTVSDSTRGTRAEGDLRLAGDVAFMTAQVFASADSRQGLTATRIELGRRDPDGRLLGPLRATEFQVGDVYTASLPLGLRGIAGRGATISNTQLESASMFDRIDLRGELPDGYEAELYRNNTLIASTRTAVNGQYQFLQVPVEFGLNVFRLVLYGPQGQRREDVRRISVGDGRLARGEFLYSFGMAQKEVNLFDVHGRDFVPGQDYGAWRGSAQLQYGLSTALTTTIGGSWYESGGRRHWLVTSGLRTGIGGFAMQLDGGINDVRGKAIEGRVGGAIAGINMTALHAEYFGTFSDELRAFTIDPLRRASEVDLNATLQLGSAASPRAIPLSGRIRRIEFADGRTQTDATLRASTLVSRMLVSNSMAFSRATTRAGPGYTRLTGAFDLATLSGSRTQYRAGLGYQVLPHARITSANVEVDRAFGPHTIVKASAGHVLDSGETTVGLSAIHRLGALSIAFDGNVTLPQKSYSAILRLGFSFGRNPLTGSLFVAQPGMATGGAVAVRAFEDSNGNRRFDPGEAPLSDIEFDTGSLTGRTDGRGTALIGQLGDANRTYLRLNGESLPDIALAPANAGVEIIPRPGRIHVSAFAVDVLSDVEGTAHFGDSRQAVSGLVLRLIDRDGKPAARVRTSAGGVFLFEQLHPGEYRVELDPGQASRLGLQLAPQAPIRLDGSGKAPKLDVLVLKSS